MPFQIVVLWTDALVFLLLALITLTVIYVRRKEHLRAPWRRVVQSRSGMVGLTVLSIFIVIGLIDCLHYRPRVEQAQGAKAVYAVEVLSVLDKLLEPLRLRHEKTYSAPLAAELYAKEIIEQPDGTQMRGYPRLTYGGAGLKDPERERAADLVRTALGGAAAGLVLWGLLSMLLAAAIAHYSSQALASAWLRIWNGGTEVPWHAVLLTLLAVSVVSGVVAALALKYHVFGTDKIGQDVLYQSLKSVQTALVIGTLTTLVMLPFALAFGIAAGYFGGWIDDAIQYLYTTLNSIPGVLLIAAAVLMMQVYIDGHAELFPTQAQRADLRLFFLCVILGVTSWTELCRLLRGETLKLKELEYIQAAHAFGVRHLRIITRHVLPNVMYIVLITVVMEFSGLVLTEAVLSYVGVGVDPSMFSFGTMINNARLEMAREPMVWWSLAAAFIFMVTVVLTANLFADAVRDAFDPRVRVLKPAARKSARARVAEGA